MSFDKRNDSGRTGRFPPRPSNPPKRPIPASREAGASDKPRYDSKPAYGDRPRRDFKPAYGDRPKFGDKPAYGDRPHRDFKPAYGDRPHRDFKPAYGDKPKFGDKPAYGDRPHRDFKPAYDDRPKFGDKPAYGDRPHRDSKPAYGDKPRFNDRPPMNFSQPRPPREYQPSPTHPQPPLPSTVSFEQDIIENLVAGRNPIREAIKSGQSFEKLLVTDGELTGSAREILSMARENGVVVQYVDKRRLDAIYPNHQGMIGFISAAQYSTVDEIFALAEEKGEPPLIVVLDGITDPHNLGAIARSAECMGAHGIIVPQRRSVGLTPSAVKAAAGALSYIKVARVVNVNRELEELKQRGVWVVGAVMDGESVDKCKLDGPLALVIGAEEDGLSQLVRKNCDIFATIPMTGKISSLNASVAASILLYEIAKSRRG